MDRGAADADGGRAADPVGGLEHNRMRAVRANELDAIGHVQCGDHAVGVAHEGEVVDPHHAT
jgi:hypothetical protein